MKSASDYFQRHYSLQWLRFENDRESSNDKYIWQYRLTKAPIATHCTYSENVLGLHETVQLHDVIL